MKASSSSPMPDGEPGGCPECGSKAPGQIFCAACGSLLWFQDREGRSRVRETLAEKITAFPHELPDPITIDALSSHGLNSLDVVELLMEIENRASGLSE